MASEPIDLTRVTPIAEMVGNDTAETESLQRLHAQARSYLESFRWCPGISAAYLGFGVAGVIGVFLFRLARPIKKKDEWLWVVVGDVPSAYLVRDHAPDPMAALKQYCGMMQEWVDAVRNGSRLSDVFPVNAPADQEHAAMLESRINFIREEIIEE